MKAKWENGIPGSDKSFRDLFLLSVFITANFVG